MAVGKNKQIIVKTLVDWTTHVTTLVPLSDEGWWWPETKNNLKNGVQLVISSGDQLKNIPGALSCKPI